MGEGELQRAADQLLDMLLLFFGPEVGDQPPGQHGAVQKRFDHPGAAQFFEDHGEVETRAAETALLFCEERADHAQFGQTFPDLGRIAGLAFKDAVACFGVVFVAQEPPQAVLQHLAFFGQVEIHLPPPSMVLAMIWRWISLEPPKIDSLRLLKYCAATGPASLGSGSASLLPATASEAKGIA